LYLAIGASGGGRIFGAVLQVILNLDWGMDISQAIEAGRVHDQLYPLEVDADDIVPDYLLTALRERGHNVTGTSLSFRTNYLRLTHRLSVRY
jgi:gamma-glutamyltranspeptidase/glutathione hydrolase/leukotriene-C4 hydrolase